MTAPAGSARAPEILSCHAGYLCGARKRVEAPVAVVSGTAAGASGFEIQDMAAGIASEALGAAESWAPVFRGTLARHDGPMGSWLVGDFSALRAGRVPRGAARRGSVVPVHHLGRRMVPPSSLFLDYVHGRRCGDFEDGLRGPCHLDDGVPATRAGRRGRGLARRG